MLSLQVFHRDLKTSGKQALVIAERSVGPSSVRLEVTVASFLEVKAKVPGASGDAVNVTSCLKLCFG